MKSTPIARFRVDLVDAMSVVDLIKHSGLPMEGMSFNSMVSLVLSGNLQSLRDKGTLPTRHADEYAKYAQYFTETKGDDRKLAISQALAGKGFKIDVYAEEEHAADLSETPHAK